MTRLQFIVKTVASSNEWSAAREFGCFVTSLVRSPTLRRNWSFGEVVLMVSQRRFMTSSKRVQDRSKNKRVHDLEIATEKHKVVSKVLVLMEMLKKEPEMIIPVKSVDFSRKQINLPKPHSIVDFIRESPKLFELYKDQKKVLWRECGLPADFRSKWVHEYPQHFKVVKSPDEVDYLELVEWNPAWAITELEKAVLGKRSYLSPYADARGLQAGSNEFDKRAISVMHELLSFTMEKRLVTDHLTHFRREFVMPQKLMRLLLKHLGVFYVSERGKRFSVFLTGAYEGAELIQKCPLVLWKEKVLSLIGYRGRKKNIETFTDILDMEDNDFPEGNSEDEGIPMQLDQQEAISELEDIAVGDSTFMDIYEIDNEYKPRDSF
ncbi:hypothetical protein NL676_029502 [Syzygium grande]|nr:hypothetical protein NL676_029502 [Syzygium grande]